MRLAFALLSTLILVSAAAFASAAVPQIGAPQLGPVPRPAKPLIVIADSVNSRSYSMGGHTDLIASIMNSISDSRYSKASLQTADAVHKAVPDLNLESELPTAFHCGQPSSLCT